MEQDEEAIREEENLIREEINSLYKPSGRSIPFATQMFLENHHNYGKVETRQLIRECWKNLETLLFLELHGRSGGNINYAKRIYKEDWNMEISRSPIEKVWKERKRKMNPAKRGTQEKKYDDTQLRKIHAEHKGDLLKIIKKTKYTREYLRLRYKELGLELDYKNYQDRKQRLAQTSAGSVFKRRW